MRVIAGEAGGRRLKSGKGREARPTGDRVKEALYNILGNYVFEANILDLYAGFGGIGIEAISRGAKKAIFVEKNRRHTKIIEENLDLTRYNDKARVIKGDVLKTLPHLSDQFDIIFLDPPYAELELYQTTLDLILEHNLIKEDGIVVFEADSKKSPEIPQGYEVLKEKNYGDTSLTFLGVKS